MELGASSVQGGRGSSSQQHLPSEEELRQGKVFLFLCYRTQINRAIYLISGRILKASRAFFDSTMPDEWFQNC